MSIKTGCSLLDFGQPLRKNGKRLPCEVMQADNAKLREFARDMWCMTTFCRGTSDAEIADMYRRMRELGFMENYGEEVDA